MSDYVEEDLMVDNTYPELFNRQAEEALIGAFIIEPDMLGEIEITKDDFYLLTSKDIYEALRDLRAERMEIDYLTLSDHLQKSGKLDQIGGQARLIALINSTPSSMGAQSYAEIVVDLSNRRRALQKANEFVRGIFKKDKPLDETISNFAISVPKLIRVKGGLEHIAKYASRHYDRIDAMTQGKEVERRFTTGIAEFDDATYGGLIMGELLILSGKPGMGKTKLMLQMAAGVADKASVGVYEMETDEEEIMDRELSRDGHIPTERFITGHLTEEEWPIYAHSFEKYSNPNFGMYIDFSPRWSLAGLRADLIRAKSQYGLNVFMIDYLKFISDKYGNGETERLNYISGELKLICRELELAGVVIHAMNKEGAKTNAPDLTSLSQGMDIVYDADKVCLLNSHIPDLGKPQENMRTFVFLKSRKKIKRSFFHMVAVKEYPELGRVKLP